MCKGKCLKPETVNGNINTMVTQSEGRVGLRENVKTPEKALVRSSKGVVSLNSILIVVDFFISLVLIFILRGVK